MASPRLPRIKKIIRTVPQRQARELLFDALLSRTGGAVQALLNDALEQAGLSMLVSPMEVATSKNPPSAAVHPFLPT